MAIQDFNLWSVYPSYGGSTITINSSNLVTASMYNYESSGCRVYRAYPTDTFKDYKLDFDISITSWQEYGTCGIFTIQGSGERYNSFSIMIRFFESRLYFKLAVYTYNFFTYGHYEEKEVSIPVWSTPMNLYFSVEKSNDTFSYEVHYTPNRNDLLVSDTYTYDSISNWDETSVSFASRGYWVEGDPSGRIINFTVTNFDIIETSSSSSSSYSSSSFSSSSSSSFSVNAVTTINDIGIADGSISSSSSSFSLAPCEFRELGTDWQAEVVNGNSAATWNSVDNRWESVHLYDYYAYVGLDSVTSFVDEICISRTDPSNWTINYGTWDAGNSRYVAHDFGYGFWYLDLYDAGSWNVGYYPIKCKVTMTFPGAPVEVSANVDGASAYVLTPTSGVEFEFNINGTSLVNNFYISSNYGSFYVTNITFCTATRVGWPIDEQSPNEMIFVPTIIGNSTATFTNIMVILDNNSYATLEYDYPVTSGEQVSIPLNLFTKPRYINNVTFIIEGNSPYQDYYIEDLYFCGSASSSSKSSSSSCRSSSSSSSSNGTEWEFVELVPAKITPIQDNGPILSPSAYHVNYVGNTIRAINLYDNFCYYQEYKDGHWSPQEEIYNDTWVGYGTSPMYSNYNGPFLSEFDGRPAIFTNYSEKDVNVNDINIFEFNYKDGGGVWNRERMSDDFGVSYNYSLMMPDQAYSATVSTVAVSPDGVYFATSFSNSWPYLMIHKRTGSTFERLTVNAPDVSPSGTCYIQTMEFSPDGNYLACGMSATPFIYIYKRTGDTFIKLANPATLPSGYVSNLNWSSDSAFLATTYYTTTRVRIYSRSGDVFTSIVPASQPASSPSDIQFSPDTNYLAVMVASSPYIYMYSRSGSTFTYVANTITLDSSSSMTWAPDSSWILFRRYYYNYDEQFLLCTHSGGTLTPSATPYSTLFDVKPRVANEIVADFCKVTPDGAFLIIGFNKTPGLAVYRISAGPVFTYASDMTYKYFGSLSISRRQFSMSTDSQYFIVVLYYSIAVFQKINGAYTQISTNGVLDTNDLSDYAGGVNNGYILMKQAPDNNFHVIIQDSPRFMHAIRDYATGDWTYSFITPTYQIPFWESGPASSEKAKAIMDVNGHIHLIYYRYYYDMPTTGSSYTKHSKLMYATNRTGSWIGSEIYNCVLEQESNLYWTPAIDVDDDITVYVLGAAFNSGLKGRVCKLVVGGSWQVNEITSWNSNWKRFKGAIHDSHFVAFDYYYRFLSFDKNTLELEYTYSPTEIQTDPYTTGDFISDGEDDFIDSWQNLDDNGLRIRALYPNPYDYYKLYKLEFSASSSSRSSTSESSSSSSSSSLESQADLWTHDLTTFTGITDESALIKDPNSTAIHAIVGSYSSSQWYKKASPSSGAWTAEGNIFGTASYVEQDFTSRRFFIKSDNTRYAFYISSNLYYKSRADGGATWSSATTVVTPVAGHAIYSLDVVEDSSGYFHILYVERVSPASPTYGKFATYNLIHTHNTTGSWTSETLFSTDKVYNDNSGLGGGVSAQILPGNIIHCFCVINYHGVVYATGFNGSWTANWFIEDRNVGAPTKKTILCKDSNNHLHMLVYYRYGHNYNLASFDYAYYNGATWTLEQEITGSVAATNYYTLIVDGNNRPHILYIKSGNLISEWVKNTYWEYVCTEQYTVSGSSYNITGAFTDGYLNLLTFSSSNKPMYSQRLLT